MNVLVAFDSGFTGFLDDALVALIVVLIVVFHQTRTFAERNQAPKASLVYFDS